MKKYSKEFKAEALKLSNEIGLKKAAAQLDPKTLTPSKDLATLDPMRLKNAEIYGQDKALSVYRNGVIEDGNHRLANALANNRAVDIEIFP